MSKVEEEKENGYRNKSNVYKFPRVKLESDQVTPSLWNLASLMFGNSHSLTKHTTKHIYL